MAKPHVQQGEIVFRQWNNGLGETIRQFKTLDEMFQLCIESQGTLSIDHVNIQGVDEQGNLRELTLVFQSITGSSE